MLEHLEFSLLRLYLFLFFNGIYAFLTFWIGAMAIRFPPFALLGLLMLIYTLRFHNLAVLRLSDSGEGAESGPPATITSIVFLILMILISFGYVLGVRWMQQLLIDEFGFPEIAFSVVATAFGLGSYFLSVYFSFRRRL